MSTNLQYYFCFRKTHEDAFLPEIGLQSVPNRSAGVDMKSLFNYEIPPRGGLCEVRTGVALEFVTSDINKIEALEKLNKQLNAATAAQRHDADAPLSSVLSPPKRRTTSSSPPSPKKKKVGFKDPLEEDLAVKDERGVVMVRSRSGMALKHKINVLAFCTSLEGDEIVIGVVNYGPEAFLLKAGERFAQLIVHTDDAVGSVDRIATKGPTLGLADYNGLCTMPVFKNTEEVKIPPGESRLVNTDNVVAMRGSDAVYMQLQSLPGATQNLMYADTHAGVIDGDYRGKVGVIIHNDSNDDDIVVPVGQDVAVGMIYKICCPIGGIYEVLCSVILDREKDDLEASDVFFTLGNRLRMLEASDISLGEGRREFHIMLKAEELFMEEGRRYVVNTGVCLKTEELRRRGLVPHVRSTYGDVMGLVSSVRGYRVDGTTGEIVLLMRGGGKLYTKDDVLAEVQLLKMGTKNEGPGLVVHDDDDDVEEAGGRGDKGFGSTGM